MGEPREVSQNVSITELTGREDSQNVLQATEAVPPERKTNLDLY